MALLRSVKVASESLIVWDEPLVVGGFSLNSARDFIDEGPCEEEDDGIVLVVEGSSVM